MGYQKRGRDDVTFFREKVAQGIVAGRLTEKLNQLAREFGAARIRYRTSRKYLRVTIPSIRGLAKLIQLAGEEFCGQYINLEATHCETTIIFTRIGADLNEDYDFNE